MGDADIDFLVDEDVPQQQQQQQRQHGDGAHHGGRVDHFRFDDDHNASDAEAEEEGGDGSSTADDDESESTCSSDDGDDYSGDCEKGGGTRSTRRNRHATGATGGGSDDDGDWSENDVRALIAKVATLRDRFARIAGTIVTHPLIWVPMNAAAAPPKSAVIAAAVTAFTPGAAAAAGCTAGGSQPHTPLITPVHCTEGALCAVNGVAKLKHRIDTELRLLTKHLGSGEYRRARCNNVAFLEIAVNVLEVERGILFVAVTLPMRSKKGDSACVELDVVTCGGLRWIKIRGSSARNLEADVVVDFEDNDADAAGEKDAAFDGARHGRATNGAVEDKTAAANESRSVTTTGASSSQQQHEHEHEAAKPRQPQPQQPQQQPQLSRGAARTARVVPVRTAFVETLARVSQASESSSPLRLPFGRVPEVVMVCAQQPTQRTLSVLAREAPRIRCIACTPGLREQLPYTDYVISCVNFDVTAMVALCSDVCNGGEAATFPANPVLQRQAISEREGQRCIANFLAPALRHFSSDDPSRISQQLLDKIGITADKLVLKRPMGDFWAAAIDEVPPQLLLADPTACGPLNPVNWIAPAAAVEEFAWIVETISGPMERARSKWLLRRLRCVDTAAHEMCSDLRAVFAHNTSVKQRQLNVFSCGNRMNAVTLSANRAFLHSAFESGQLLCCASHPARAFTERKRLGTDIQPSRDMFREGNQRPKNPGTLVQRTARSLRQQHEQQQQQQQQPSQPPNTTQPAQR